MRASLDHIEKELGLGADKHRPILIDRAAEILLMTVGTVRRLVNNLEIPHYISVGITSISSKMS